jgi:hypothetical protein
VHSRAASRRHGWWLWWLLGLFVIRVLAQPLSLFVVAVFAFLAWTLSSATVTPRRRVGMLVLVAGGTYLAAMLARLVLGATILSSEQWFARPLPTAFHLVLASVLLVYGHFHARYGSKD